MNTDKQIDRLVNAFVTQLREVVAEATKVEVAAALQKAIGGKGARGVAGRRGMTVPVDAAGRRAKRSPRQMANQTEKLYEYIKGNPGLRMEQIVEGMVLDTALLQPLIKRLVAEKRIKAKGKARGTTYTVG